MARNDSDNSRAHALNVLSLRLGTERKILSGNVSIDVDGPTAHFYEAGGADRTLTLPPFVNGGGTTYFIANVGAADDLLVQSANALAVATIAPGTAAFIVASESEWRALLASSASIAVFGPSGPSHSEGLVPDPGVVAGSSRYLREDGSWSIPIGGGSFDGYAFITDGTNTAAGTGSDTFKIRSSDGAIGVTVTNNDGTHGDNVNLTVNEANVDHNTLANYVADQHVAHSGVTLTAGEGLSGGGTIAASRTFDLDLNDLTLVTPVLADTFGFYDVSAPATRKATLTTLNSILDHNALLNYSADRHIDHSTVSVQAGIGLSGGGAITATVTLNVDFTEFETGEALTATDLIPFYDASESDHNTTTFSLFNSSLDHNVLANYSANQHIDHSTVSISTAVGSGLTGGGSIASTRTLSLDINELTADTPVTGDFIAFYDISGSDNNKVTLANLATAIGVLSVFQPKDTTLDNFAAYNSDGLLTQTAADTFIGRTLAAPAAGFTITNPAGIAGNPTFALANDLAALEALAGTNNIYYRSAADTWTAVTIGSNLTFTGGTLAASSGTATVGDGDYGDIVVTGTGTIWTIDTAAVSYAKMQDVSAASKLLGRGDSGSGDVQEITLGAGLAMTGTTLSSSGGAGAPASASYVVLGLDGTLSAERVLTPGAGLTMTDGGADTTITLDVGAGTGITVNANDVALTVPVTVANGGTGQTSAAEAIGELIQALTADTTPDPAADYIGTYDADVDTGKKVLINDLITAAEAQIETVIDTLGNLTSIQGVTLTLADAGTDAFLAWDDSASKYQNLSAADAAAIISGTNTFQPLDADLTSWALIARASGFDTFVASPSSANLATLITNETGSGLLVFGTSPQLTTPQIQDASSTHQYVFAASELAANRTVTLPLLTAGDTFVFEAFAQTLTNKGINLANNTLTGTVAEFNAALATQDFYTTGGTDVAVADGGTGASTLTGILQGNGTSAFTAIASSTVGQVLRVTGAATYAWGAVDLSDTDAITNDLPFANLTQIAAKSVLGVAGTSTADVAGITGTADQVLRIDAAGTGLGFGTVATNGIAAGAITFAKIQNITTDRLIGRDTAASGSPEEISVSGGLEWTGGPGIQRSALTGDVTATAGSNATTIATAVVSNAKLADVPTATLKGRVAASTGVPTDLTGTQATTLLDVFTSSLKGLVPSPAGATTTFLKADGTWATPAGGGGGGFTVSASPPGSPTSGAGWYDLDTGYAALYVDDGSSSQWVQINGIGPVGPAGPTGSTPLAYTVVALTDGATPALDASLGNIFTLSAAGNRTIAVPSNPTNGQKIVIRHLASGAIRTLALNTGAGGFRFGTDITALTATASGKTDYIGAIYSSIDSFWDVVAYSKGY